MKKRRLVDLIFALLLLQFVLGMLANLYATIPQQRPYEVFHQFGYILFHAVNGTLLVVLSIVYAVKQRKQKRFRAAVAGLAHLLFAFTFGEFFVFTQNDIFSFLMALAFLGALIIYARIVFSATSARS